MPPQRSRLGPTRRCSGLLRNEAGQAFQRVPDKPEQREEDAADHSQGSPDYSDSRTWTNIRGDWFRGRQEEQSQEPENAPGMSIHGNSLSPVLVVTGPSLNPEIPLRVAYRIVDVRDLVFVVSVDVLPDDLPIPCDLDHSSGSVLHNQDIPVVESLVSPPYLRVELLIGTFTVDHRETPVPRIDFNDATPTEYRTASAVSVVVEH